MKHCLAHSGGFRGLGGFSPKLSLQSQGTEKTQCIDIEMHYVYL